MEEVKEKLIKYFGILFNVEIIRKEQMSSS
jgi:hypothetical protein